MQFNKNKKEPVHRWYSFVEGYSKEFIQSIIKETKNRNIVCLDPFSGSGTTALELQNQGIKCVSFEVNPFMYLVSKVKLFSHYSYEEALYWYNYIMGNVHNNTLSSISSVFTTLYQSENKDKWNINTDVGIAIEKLRQAIKSINEGTYSDLYMVALSSILLEVSNLYRNGKCLSYRADWKEQYLSQKDVFTRFSEKVKQEYLPDIKAQESLSLHRKGWVENYQFLYNKDSRIAINEMLDDNSFDLVITSPPYLNSRDYTDTYMLELKTLGFTHNIQDIAALRQKTFRSHVQIKWNDSTVIDNAVLNITLQKLKKAEEECAGWNSALVDMIRLYFVDITTIFSALSRKVKTGGRVYFNVSNSAYFGIEIDTLEICASIAENLGFSIEEIRKARYLKTSPQQKKTVGKLLEGVIVMERNAKHE